MRNRSILMGLLGLSLSTSCEETATVEIKTFVGEPYEQADPDRSWENLSKVLEAAIPTLAATRPDAVVLSQTSHPPTTKAEFDELVAAIRSGPIDDLAGPANRLAEARPEVWNAVKTALLAPRKAPKGDYRSVLATIGGDVPNRYGHFARAWKKAHGHRVKLSEDWFSDLLALPRAKISPVLSKVFRDCVLQAALIRGAAHIGSSSPQHTDDAAKALLDAAYLHQGTFRDEVGRALSSIGDVAVPTLILESVPPSTRKRDQDKPEVRRAAYARHILDRMDRLHPARAVAAVSEQPALVAELLAAYGVVKWGESAEVILSLAADRSPAIRKAAVAAFRGFVTGPLPKTVSRDVRLLGGGTGKARAFLSYRQMALRAIRDRLEAEAPMLLEPQCELVGEDGKLDKVCEGQPLRLTQAYFSWLNLRQNLDETAQIDAALAATDPDKTAQQLNRLLAVNPELGHTQRLVDFFEKLADLRRQRGELDQAAQLLRKTAMLLGDDEPDKARDLRVRALVLEASVPGLNANGQRMLLASASELDPHAEEVKAAIAAISDQEQARGNPRANRHILLGTASVLAGLIALMGLAIPMRRLLFGRSTS